MLGRSGQPDRVRILATQPQRDVLYVLVEDRGRQPIAGIDRQFWRAFLEVNGRMTALSVLGFAGAGVGAAGGAEPARRPRRARSGGEPARADAGTGKRWPIIVSPSNWGMSDLMCG